MTGTYTVCCEENYFPKGKFKLQSTPDKSNPR